jgi:predicted DNA-binding transcriptional regulator YafY
MSATEIDAAEVVEILYTNYRGEKGWRRIRPLRMRFGQTSWHPDSHWLLDALDLDKKAERSFAMRDIGEWRFAQA